MLLVASSLCSWDFTWMIRVTPPFSRWNRYTLTDGYGDRWYCIDNNDRLRCIDEQPLPHEAMKKELFNERWKKELNTLNMICPLFTKKWWQADAPVVVIETDGEDGPVVQLPFNCSH